LLLLPQILSFIEKLRNNSNTSQDESQLSNVIDGFIGPSQVQDSTTLTTTGQVLVNNLKSNVTLTPLPNDPLFGNNGIFTSIFDLISNRKKEVAE